MKKRLAEIDIVRGITITLVVLGHTTFPYDQISEVLKSFRMPLFFLVSGYLFSLDRYLVDFKGLITKRFMSLVIPYFSAWCMVYMLWLTKQTITTGHIPSNWNQGFLGVLYGNGDWIFLDPALWFLVCLFCSQIIFCFVMSFIKTYSFKVKFIFFIVLGIIGFVISKFIFLPWGLDIALVVQLFLFLGNELKKQKKLEDIPKPKVVALVSILVFILSVIINPSVDMNKRIYGDLFFFYMSGISGSVIVILITKYFLSKISVVSKIFSYLGKQSLMILCFHMASFLFLANFIKESNLSWVFYTIVGIVSSLIVGIIINKIPFLYVLFNGKKKQPIVKQHDINVNGKAV